MPPTAYSSPEELRSLGVELEDAGCALCSSTEYRPVLVGQDRLHGGPGRFQVVACRRCGLMRTNPRPTFATIGLYYPQDYEPYIETASEDRHRRRHAVSRIVSSLDTAIPLLAPGRLLEIGSASGNYLVAMQRAGWHVTGVEFDPTAAATAARTTGADVRVGGVLDTDFPPASFDLVCGWMVFEHLHDPVSAFARVFEWLTPGGWLAFSVPDAGNWQLRTFGDAWFALQLPTHLYHFTKTTIRRVLSSRGYEAISIRSQRTLFDVAMSCAYRVEDAGLVAPGTGQRIARSTPSRALVRAGGILGGPLGLSGRMTVWARRRR